MEKICKIAHVVPPFNPVPPINSAGTELRVYNVAKHAKRFRPVVYSRWFPGFLEKEVIDGVSYERIKIGKAYRRIFQKIVPWDPYSFNDRVGRRIAKLRPEIVHLHNEPKLLRRMWRYAKRSNSKLLLHVANEKEIDSHLLKHVDHFIACSHYIASWLNAGYGVSRGKITTVYTGTDVARIRPVWEVPDIRQRTRGKFGLRENDIVVLFAGRIVHEKGVKELVEAFTLVKEASKGHAVKLVLAGDIRKSDDPDNRKAVYGKQIRELVKDRKDIILTDTIPPLQMPDFYTIGDVFVLPAIWNDPFPTALLEAAAAGLPIVTTNKGGIPEFITDEVNGILVNDARNASELASKILAVLDDSELGGKVAKNARRDVERSFSWQRVADELENLYSRILQSSAQELAYKTQCH